MPGKQQLDALTGLRFLLALWVVVFHQSAVLGPVPFYIAGILHTGYVAVGFFFVLSGFVLAYNYPLVKAWSRKEVGRFGVARLSRIYPAYLLGLVAAAPVLLFGAHGSLRQFSAAVAGKESFTALLSLSLLQSWVPQAALSWNGPGWSLSNEAFFYLCFPFIGLPLWRLSRTRSIVAAALCIWAAALIAPFIAIAVPIAGFGNVPATFEVASSFWPNLVKFNPLLRLPEFCTGILLARAYTLLKQSPLSGRGYYLYLPALAAVATTLSLGSSIPYPAIHNSVLLPLYACIILGFALGGGPVAALLATRPFTFLGGASYSLYILHFPLTCWFFGVGRRIYGHEVAGPGVVALYIALAIALSALVFKLVEEPLNKVLRRTLSPAAKTPLLPANPPRDSVHGQRLELSWTGNE